MNRLEELKIVELGEKIGYKKGFEAARKQFERPHGDGKREQEWHPIKTRLMDPEERASFAEYWGIDYADTQLERAFDCLMPEDQERILICTKWGVDIDTCEYDPDEGYSLEDRGDWEDVIAWMPLPEPYKKEGESE